MSKQLAFEASTDAVRFLLNRNDLSPEERRIIEEALAKMEGLKS